MHIYPFKGVYNTFNSTHNFESLERRNNDQLDQAYIDSFFQENEAKLYCCRISYGFNTHIGLIGVIEAQQIQDNLHLHEKLLHTKYKKYCSTFRNDQYQNSPIIIMHKYVDEIEQALKEITQSPPILSVNYDEYFYECWTIDNISKYQQLYLPLGNCLLLDGHHRFASLISAKRDALISAYFVSPLNIISGIIHRRYFHISATARKQLLAFLSKNFILKKVNKTSEYENFVFNFGDYGVYVVHDSNFDTARRIILEFLEAHINYYGKSHNFENSLYVEKKFPSIQVDEPLSVLIPAYNVNSLPTKKISLYPPHSTLFYPKIASNIILFKRQR